MIIKFMSYQARVKKSSMVAYKYTKSTFIGSDNELLDVTQLDCSYCGISSFEGLNAPNLTRIDCSYNTLTSFQHLNCPMLTEMHCSNNNLTFFQHLNCPALTTLTCSCNKLTSFQHLNCHLLTTLTCSYNKLTSFQHLNCPALTKLYCSNNNLTSFQHLNCPLLTMLYCHYNNLTSFQHLNCPLLTTLTCSYNKLTSFQHLNCPALTKLTCSNNNLTSFQHLNCPALTTLTCSYNNLTSFQHLNCPALTTLTCSGNNLTSFQHLNCPVLTTLHCSYNNLTSFQHFNCPALTMLHCSGNEWEFIPPHINRLLNTTRNTQNVYSDKQNVHNHHIQECIRSSIQAVLSKKPCIAAENIYETILADTVLTMLTKEILVDYCKETTVHSTLRITFEELLVHVFSRIECNANKEEIKNVLNAEMSDSVCKCFTGRMSRLINCLNGFDDLVSIRISDTEQIGQVIGMIKEQLDSENKYTVEKHREMASDELRARDYSEEIIAEWIAFIE